jgi:hypothetical protein
MAPSRPGRRTTFGAPPRFVHLQPARRWSDHVLLAVPVDVSHLVVPEAGVVEVARRPVGPVALAGVPVQAVAAVVDRQHVLPSVPVEITQREVLEAGLAEVVVDRQ